MLGKILKYVTYGALAFGAYKMFPVVRGEVEAMFPSLSSTVALILSIIALVVLSLIAIFVINLVFALIEKATQGVKFSKQSTAISYGNYNESKSLPRNARRAATTSSATSDDDWNKQVIKAEVAYTANQNKDAVRKWLKGKNGIFRKKRNMIKEIKKQVGPAYGWDSGQIIGAQYVPAGMR
jgi:hypothetical protein